MFSNKKTYGTYVVYPKRKKMLTCTWIIIIHPLFRVNLTKLWGVSCVNMKLGVFIFLGI
jgi:hypothetical protein